MMIEQFAAMGTRITVIDAAHRVTELEAMFEANEAACSRFRPGSDLERLNDAPGTMVEVPDAILTPIRLASAMRTRTGGLVDIGLGAVLLAWGYDRTFGEVTGIPTAGVHRTPQWWLDGPVLHRSPGTRLDLGGIAKGWTVDGAIERGLATVVSAGGDLRSAAPDTAVEIVDPTGSVAARVELGVGALATSSVSRRRWEVGNSAANHLIDPRTLRPAATPILSATAVTETAVEAEAAAKAILLLGEEGLAWADRQSWIRGAVAIWSDASVYATTGLALAAA